MCLYNNAAKIFGAEGILCRRLEIFEWNMAYEACVNGCIITTSAWLYFFEKSFRAPKIVPKITNYHLKNHIFCSYSCECRFLLIYTIPKLGYYVYIHYVIDFLFDCPTKIISVQILKMYKNAAI